MARGRGHGTTTLHAGTTRDASRPPRPSELSLIDLVGQSSIPDDGRPPTHIIDGRRIWKKDDDPQGTLHRVGGPALILPDGSWKWHYGGGLHRATDLPAVYIAGADGFIEYWVHGERHREGGEPAFIAQDGRRFWFYRGIRHRESGPAVVYPNGTKQWWWHGLLHRQGAPAVVDPSGIEEWWTGGKLHRVGGPALVREDKSEEWLQHGRLHREGGPAKVGPDGSEWFRFDLRHREDGPAIERPDGTRAWFLEGVELSHDDWRRRIFPSRRRPSAASARSVADAMNRR